MSASSRIFSFMAKRPLQTGLSSCKRCIATFLYNFDACCLYLVTESCSSISSGLVERMSMARALLKSSRACHTSRFKKVPSREASSLSTCCNVSEIMFAACKMYPTE